MQTPEHNDDHNDKDKNGQGQSLTVKTPWAKSVSRIAITAIVFSSVVFLVVYLFGIPRALLISTDKILSNRAEDVKKIIVAFNSGTVRTNFYSRPTTVSSSNFLQLTKLENTETFNKADSFDYWADVEVEIRAPVEYTFYVDLRGEWKFRVKEHENLSEILEIPEVSVFAPEIKWNKPSVDISRMTNQIRRSSIFRNEEALIKKLQAEITEILNQRASEQVNLIREIARKSAKQFIEDWFLNTMFKDFKVKPRIVSLSFADELPQDMERRSFDIPHIEEKLYQEGKP